MAKKKSVKKTPPAKKKSVKKTPPAKEKKNHYRYRSSITGELVTEKFALDNPDTTQRETIQAWERGDSIPCAKNETK